MEDIWIETYTGNRVDPLHIWPKDIDIKDIASSLSKLCRYTGHCSRFYSVGQHSLHVCFIVQEMRNWEDPEEYRLTKLAALLHDASEAYMNDISRPVKYSFKLFKEIEARLMGAVVDRFNLHGADWRIVNKADNVMLATEAYQLMPSKGEGWHLPEEKLDYSISMNHSMADVEETFITTFKKYGGK